MVAGPDPAMAELVAELGAASLPLYVLTNMPRFRVFDDWVQDFPILGAFDGAAIRN